MLNALRPLTLLLLLFLTPPLHSQSSSGVTSLPELSVRSTTGWQIVEGTNMDALCDLKTNDANAFFADLDAFIAFVRDFAPEAALPVGTKVTFFVTKSGKVKKASLDRSLPIVAATAEQLCIILQTAELDSDALHALRRDVVLASFVFRSPRWPLWFETGMAQTLAMAEITSDETRIGKPPDALTAPHTTHVISYDEVLSTTAESSSCKDRDFVSKHSRHPLCSSISHCSADTRQAGMGC